MRERRAATPHDALEVIVECGAARVCVRGAVAPAHLAALPRAC
ncbi:MAG: hypothetical protein ACLQVI_24095 [Polyangiaceae bacterium]